MSPTRQSPVTHATPPSAPPPRAETFRRTNRLLGIAIAVLTVSALTLGTLVLLDHGKDKAEPVAQSSPGSSAAPGGSANGVSVTQADLDGLMTAQTQALQKGDQKAYMAAFDPAKPDLVARQQKTFANLRKIDFTTKSFKLVQQRGRASDSFGRGVQLTLDVQFLHQIPGVDVAPVVELYEWTVTRASAKAPLLIDDVAPVTAVGADDSSKELKSFTFSYPAPWDLYDDVSVVTRPHVTLLSDARLAAKNNQFADTAEQAAQFDLAAWKGAPGTATKFLVTFEDNRDNFYKLYDGQENNHGSEAGFSIPMTTGDDKKPVGGARISIDVTTSFFDGTRPNDPRELLRHEMAHSLVAPLSGAPKPEDTNGTPTWLIEGFAEWMAGKDGPVTASAHYGSLQRYVQGRSFDGHLPASADVRSQDLNKTNASYELSALVLRFIAEKYGEDKVYALISTVYQQPGDATVEPALRTASGLGKSDFETAWAAYVRGLVH